MAAVTELAGSRFPPTRDSVVAAIGDPDPEVRRCAFEVLVAAYWRPVYKYLRLRWRVDREQAEDLTQGFFAHAFEKGTLDPFDARRARFRTWIRTCLDGFVSNERRAAQRLKRGGGAPHLPLEFEDAEGELRRLEPPAADDLESFFHREWVRGLVALSLEELRAKSEAAGRRLEFTLFERYDVEPGGPETRPTYAELAKQLGVSETKVTNALHAMRRRFRQTLLERLRVVTAGEAEFEAEARELFGAKP
jgi:RNA polymerase sigma factor (sigma-70 family)